MKRVRPISCQSLLSGFFWQIKNLFAASLSETVPFTLVTDRDQTIFPLAILVWCVAPESRTMYNINLDNDIYMSADIQVIVFFVYCTLLKNIVSALTRQSKSIQKNIKVHIYKYVFTSLSQIISLGYLYLPGPITIISIAAEVPFQAQTGVVLRNSSLPSLDVKSDNFLMLRVRIY